MVLMGARAFMVMVGHPQVMRATGGQCMIVTVAVGIAAATRAAAITFLKIIHPDAQSCKCHVHARVCVRDHHHQHHHVLVFLLCYTLLIMLSQTRLHISYLGLRGKKKWINKYGGLNNVGGVQFVVHLSAT
jgi:hypothetical protein